MYIYSKMQHFPVLKGIFKKPQKSWIHMVPHSKNFKIEPRAPWKPGVVYDCPRHFRLPRPSAPGTVVVESMANSGSGLCFLAQASALEASLGHSPRAGLDFLAQQPSALGADSVDRCSLPTLLACTFLARASSQLHFYVDRDGWLGDLWAKAALPETATVGAGGELCRPLLSASPPRLHISRPSLFPASF